MIRLIYALINGFFAQTEAVFDSWKTISIYVKAKLYKRFQEDCKPLFLLIPEFPRIGGARKPFTGADGVV